MSEERQILICPECDGHGYQFKQYGYCPTAHTEEEQLEILRSCCPDAKDVEVIGRGGDIWKIRCPLCKGKRFVSVHQDSSQVIQGGKDA